MTKPNRPQLSEEMEKLFYRLFHVIARLSSGLDEWSGREIGRIKEDFTEILKKEKQV